MGASIAAVSLGFGIGNVATGGGRSGGGGGIPTAASYIPGNQAAMDANYSNLVNQSMPYAFDQPRNMIPQYQAYTNNILNNPYSSDPINYAGVAQNFGYNSLVPWQQSGMTQLGNAAGAIAAPLANAINQPNPSSFLTYGPNAANQQLGAAFGPGGAIPMGNQQLGNLNTASNILNTGAQGYANNLLGVTGGPQAANFLNEAMQPAAANNFDPTGSIYNQMLQRTMDTQNAINAQSGLSTSPYGAGLTGNAVLNFNNEWQNQLQARNMLAQQTAGQAIGNQATAAQAYGGLVNTGAQGYGNILGGMANAYGGITGPTAQAYQSLMGGTGNLFANLMNPSTSGYANVNNSQTAGISNLLQAMGQGYSGASDLGQSAIAQMLASGSYPYSAYNALQNTNLGALNTLNSGMAGSFGLGQQAINNAQSYLGLGQSAGYNALAAQQQGFNQSQILGNQIGQNLSGVANGLGSLFGGPATIPNVAITPPNVGGYTSGYDPYNSGSYFDPYGSY